MRLQAYAQTFWLESAEVVEVTQATGSFKRVYGVEGKDWLARAEPAVRKVFSELGLRRLRELDINLPSLGGKARAQQASRDKKGRFSHGTGRSNQREVC